VIAGGHRVIIFGFLAENVKMAEAVAVAFSMAWAEGGAGGDGEDEVLGRLAGFRCEFWRCLTRRADALFGLADAVLCAPGRVSDLARLSLVPECGRGHGGLYDGLNHGRVQIGPLRQALAGLALPAWPDGRIRLGVDVCNWLRPDAQTSPGRLMCHVKGRAASAAQILPGWPYSFVVALGPGRSSWTLPLDAVRLGPDDDVMAVTAAQLRGVIERLIAAGHWKPGDPGIVIAADAGYSGTRLAWLLADLPVIVLTRVRSNRVYYRRPPARAAGTRGRPARHGARVACADPGTWTSPDLSAAGESARHGPLQVTAWEQVHQMTDRTCTGWEDWPAGQEMPLIEGTLIRLAAPARPALEPMWLWASDPAAASPAAAAMLWQAYLRRFDIESTFRFLKSQLGWDKPMLRDPAAADRWTWLIIASYAQLWLARDLLPGIRLPWQRPRPPGTAQPLTPGQVRTGFRLLRQAAGTPAGTAKTGRPGPGRPAGSKNKHKAPRHPARKKKQPSKPRRQTGTGG
jgi:DDE superfamily endonuclease